MPEPLAAEERGDWAKFIPLFRYRYNRSHLPVRKRKSAEGHSVRAMNLYSGMTDVAAETEDRSLFDACKALWNNVTGRRMYVTGGIGSSAQAEAFTIDYDLPNDTAYADVMERAFYNGVLPERQKWIGCVCCPPNIARLIASVGQYIHSSSADGIYVHLYTDSTARIKMAEKQIEVAQKTNYPWDENVRLSIHIEEGTASFTLAPRVPGWCGSYDVSVNGESLGRGLRSEKGYVKIEREWNDGDTVSIRFAMPVERVYSSPQVRMNTGKVAIQRGPVIYCAEEADNGPNIAALPIPRNAALTAEYEASLLGGVSVIRGDVLKDTPSFTTNSLHGPAPLKQRHKLVAIPCFAWANRRREEMSVWLREC